MKKISNLLAKKEEKTETQICVTYDIAKYKKLREKLKKDNSTLHRFFEVCADEYLKEK